MYKKLGILAIAGMLLLGTGIGPVLAKMPGNFSTNPDVLKIEINQTTTLIVVSVYHDLKAGYWDIYYAGWLHGGEGDKKISQGNVSFPDSQVNRIDWV